MGHTKNKTYGKTVKRPLVNAKIKDKYTKALAKAEEEYSHAQRKINFPKEFMNKFPNIFEVDQ